MFSKITSFFMSIFMFIASLLGINLSKQPSGDMISYDLTKKVVSVSLTENGSTGYKWQYKIENEKVAKLVSDSYTYSAPADLIGAAGTRTFSFKGLTEGKTKIILTYERSWEVLPADTVIILLTVNADKTVEATVV